jgi:hypothetical protein
MAEHGGYRQPSNPAPVSGPGAHSQRTDRGPKQHEVTGGSYGSSQEFAAQQSAAPLAPSPGAPGGTAPAPAGPDLSSLVGLGAPSRMPSTPVTDGAAAGAGVGPEALGLRAPDPSREEARALAKWLPTLIEQADADNATPAFRQYVRGLIRKL